MRKKSTRKYISGSSVNGAFGKGGMGGHRKLKRKIKEGVLTVRS